MARLLAFALIAALLAAESRPADAQPAKAMAITCRLLLSEAPIPGNPGHSIRIQEITVAAGHDGHRHQHDSVEYLHVIGGSGSISIEGQPETPLATGKVVVIPRKTPHQIHNHAATATLTFIATFIENEAEDHTITVYLGEADTQNGCPHTRPAK